MFPLFSLCRLYLSSVIVSSSVWVKLLNTCCLWFCLWAICCKYNAISFAWLWSLLSVTGLRVLVVLDVEIFSWLNHFSFVLKTLFSNLYVYADMPSITLHVTAAISLNTKHYLAALLDRFCAHKVNIAWRFNTIARLSLHKVQFTFLI